MRPSRLLVSLLLLFTLGSAARGDWRRGDASLSWTRGDAVLWTFSFDPKEGKPHFATLATGGGADLAVVHPEDHYWHYGLWFSWKFINGVNYWEEGGPNHRAEGATRWTVPEIETRADGSATIRLSLNYIRPDGRIDLTEVRVLRISAPAADGTYALDWAARFVATGVGVVLDRTPLLGEPDGRVYGGYGGLGFRLPPAPLKMEVLTPTGAVAQFESERARPRAAAVACNFTAEGKDLGGVAVVNVAAAPAAAAEIPWYVINGDKMRFVCASILAPKPLTLAAGAVLDLRYRIVVRPTAWTPESLRAATGAKRE